MSVFILESIFIPIPMKISTTIRQTAITAPVSTITNHPTSRRKQTEIVEDYSQVRVYYIFKVFYRN